MSLPALSIIFVCAFVSLLLLKLLRFGWMTRQARTALRREMARRNLTVNSIRRFEPWGPHFDTAWEAFWHLSLHYDVKGHTADGDERKVWFTAYFAPVVGTLRSVDFKVPKRPLGDKGGTLFGLEDEDE